MSSLDEALARLNGPTTHQSDIDIVTAEVARERREWADMSLAWNQELDAANTAIRAAYKIIGYVPINQRRVWLALPAVKRAMKEAPE